MVILIVSGNKVIRLSCYLFVILFRILVVYLHSDHFKHTFMEDTAIPYELPEVENHSFFFIDQRVETGLEAKLHQHDAWELYYVVHGYGKDVYKRQPLLLIHNSLYQRTSIVVAPASQAFLTRLINTWRNIFSSVNIVTAKGMEKMCIRDRL